MFYRKSSNNQGIQLEWQILSRDCIIYVISVGLLVLVMWDGLITWYEATIFIVLFVGYLVLLFSGEGITRWYNKMKHLCWNGTEFTEESGELVHSSVLFKYRLCSLSFFFLIPFWLFISFFFFFVSSFPLYEICSHLIRKRNMAGRGHREDKKMKYTNLLLLLLLL